MDSAHLAGRTNMSASKTSLPLRGYQLVEVLHEGIGFDVCRARAEATGETFVLKTALPRRANPRNVAQLKHEHAILQRIDSIRVVKPHGLIEDGGHAALVLQDIGGVALSQLLRDRGATLSFDARLNLALELTRALGDIHAADVVHKDINPSNIVVNPETLQMQIIDFSIASLLSRERAAIAVPGAIEGTLRYIAPEQTGRMNRVVDYRCDYYSLGVTLYELFTGRVPFDSNDLMELVHSHIAKIPEAPEHLDPAIPPSLSRVIMKLLAKMAEDRYQSSYAIARELRSAEDSGTADVSSHLQISQKLYGRDAEVATLLEAFTRIRGEAGGDGRSELILVAGYSGIGKSSIVNEIHKPIAARGGYFVDGKFDQFKRNIPYASMIAALRELVRQLLTESPAELAAWRDRIHASLGVNAQVVVEVIPEVELIIGAQPAVPVLGALAAKNRFNLSFRDFIRVLATPEHPLVLFLDDLQWADAASLELLEVLLTDAAIRNMLVIGAYRDNEVDASHPLELSLARLRKSETARLHTIVLAPLAAAHVLELVVDTLHCSTTAAAPLAALLLRKTEGNPFFLVQMLHEIYRRGILVFDEHSGSWRWSIEAIEALGFTDNVVELMVGKLRGFAPETQRVLTTAACIGNRFGLELLALVHGASPTETAAALWPALEAEFVQPVNVDYKAAAIGDRQSGRAAEYEFMHDRVQQAAYELTDAHEHARLHAQTGRLLLEHYRGEELEERLFDVTMHLNLGIGQLDADLRRHARALNHRAARRARDSSAYDTAAACLRAAIDLLDEDCWESNYAETLALYCDGVEIEYLNINFERAEANAEIVLAHSRTLLDKIFVYETRIQFYVSENKMQATIDLALEVLALLGITLVETPPQDFPSDAELLALPPMEDPTKLAAMRILMAMMPACYIAAPALLPTVSYTMVTLCRTHGNCDIASYAFALFALIQCGVLGNIDAGYRFGRLALEFLDRYEAKKLESKVYALFYIFVIHWKDHLREALDGLLHGVRAGLETGDIEYAGYNAIHYCTFPLFLGRDLVWLDEEMQTYERMSLKLQQQYQLYYIRMWRQLLLGLREQGCDGQHLAGSSFDERTMLANLGENRTSHATLHQARATLLYLFGHHRAAVDSSRRAREYIDATAGFVTPVIHNLYYSLALLATFSQLSEPQQREALQIVDENQAQLKAWATHAPENNQHKYELVAAERERATGSPLAALAHYERAIAGARANGYLNDEALAYERMGEALLALGHHELAQHQLGAARNLYRSWGALAKANALAAAYPQLSMSVAAPRWPSATVTTGTFSTEALDMVTVVKASQALASEIVLDKLLHSLMRIMIENVGGQAGVLLLIRNEQPTIVARATVSSQGVEVVDEVAPADADRVPMSLIHYVIRTRQEVVLNDVAQTRTFGNDRYFADHQAQSVVCAPILRQEQVIGVLYFEHSQAIGVFTPARIEVLNLLCAQVAISIENSQLYERLEEHRRTLEQKVDERTRELSDKNLDLQRSLARIREMQQQIIEQEKLASLGSVTAGVAHEIRNPLNFINNFSGLSIDLADELQHELAAVRPQLGGAADEFADTLTTLRDNLRKVCEHGERIDSIIRMMLNLSRDGTVVRERVELNSLVAEYIKLGHHGVADADDVLLETDFDDNIGTIELVRHDIGRVLLNLMSNAHYALREKRQRLGPEFAGKIRVTTRLLGDELEICVHDNGLGIPQANLDKIFNPFFTTKPTGTGPGLGLSISHEIITSVHGGTLSVRTDFGNYAEFVIRLPKAGS
jgi:predicted ATPase/signal transduction histidine kinase